MTSVNTAHGARILLAEDDEILRITLSDSLKKNGWIVDEASDGKEALSFIKKNTYKLVLSDIRMPGLDGQQLLTKIKDLAPGTDVILMTAYGGTEDAVACLKLGAADYILKPFDMDDLLIRIKRLLEIQEIKVKCSSLEENCQGKRKPIVGKSGPVQAMLKLISQVALSDATVLVSGESGTGKELVAAAIHFGSKRAEGPYIRINCAAIPEGLMESELFGHEKGAFTGATSRKIGKFELANRGTILLDEIGDMPLELQAKLLRVLQEHEIERVGGAGPVPIDARVICATAKKLAQEVEAGKFREDLFYRLQVIPVEVPPLRDRKEDIGDLCQSFLAEFSRERGMEFQLSDEALGILQSYDYPGNVRELKNIIERVSVLATSPVIEAWNLPPDISGSFEPDTDETMTLSVAVANAEKACIVKALRRTEGNKTEASALLGISRKNLWEKLKTYKL
ncbi:MAG: sigma-54 dependent transcriptional regulator [Desulfobulbaceae bacterium]|nr:sigma-54 dependent transcriptional regulator [Desulfobulbaceae bacterium]